MAKRFKLQHEREICIGCGACEAVAPDFWKMDDDGKSNLVDSTEKGNTQERELDDIAENQEAAEVCPVNCIHVYENGEKKI